MRHVRIAGQNLKNMSSFKNQIGDILKQLNKFEDNDKSEALTYLRKCIDAPSSSHSTTKERTRQKRKASQKTKLRTKTHRLKASKSPKRKEPIPPKRPILKCNICKVVEKTKQNMLRHLDKHVGSPISCIQCRQTFNGEISFNWHLKNTCKPWHQRKPTLKCNQCPKKFLLKNTLHKHLQSHKRNNCSHCGKVLAKRIHLIKHLMEVHSVNLARNANKCSQCDKSFIKKCSLYYHIQQHFPEKFVCLACGHISNNHEESLGHKAQHEVNKHFTCSECGEKFSGRQHYLYHLQKHGRYKCITCNEAFASQAKIMIHKKQGHQIVGLKKKAKITNRIVKRAPKRMISCQHCNYRTIQKCNMERHVSLHFKQKQFTCEHCGKSCQTIFSLKDHISYNHLQTKLFQCDKCGKSFRRNSELVRHQNSHSDERRYVCALCGKTYKRANHLTRHEKTAHKIVKTKEIKQVSSDDNKRKISDGSGKSGQIKARCNWEIDNTELFKVYTDMNLNCGHLKQQQ